MKDKTRKHIDLVLENPFIHEFSKEILREGLTKDPIDAVDDVKLALKCLEMRLDDILSNA